MQKDLKIGLIVGLAVVSVAGLWLATRPSLSPQARMKGVHDAGVVSESDGRQGATRRPPEVVDTGERDTRDTSTVRVPIRRTTTSERVDRASVPKPALYEQPERTKPQKFHVVRDGETLSQISYDYYGSAVEWRRIFEANRKTVKDANVVMPGTKLIIPN